MIAALATASAVAIVGPFVAIGIVAGVGALVVAVVAPGALFAVYLLSGTYKAAVQPFSPVDVTLGLASLCALQAVALLPKRPPSRISKVGLGLVVAVGALYAGGTLYAPDPAIALKDAATYWGFVVIAMVPAAMRVGSQPRFVRQFLWTLFALGIPMTVVGLTQLSVLERLRVFGASTIEVSRAALLVPIVGLTFVVSSRWVLLRAVAVALVPAAIVVAVAAGSRGPLLSLVIVATVAGAITLWRPARTRWRRVAVVGAAAFASALIVVGLGASLPVLSTSRFGLFEDFLTSLAGGGLSQGTADTSAGQRLALFEVAASMFTYRPILGYGTGAFAAMSPVLMPPPHEAWPHNAVLQFAAEFGLVGVGLFAALVLVTLRRPFPRGHPGVAVLAAFGFFLLNAMVSDDIYGSRPTWGLLALVLLLDLPRLPVPVATFPAEGRGEGPARTGRRSLDLGSRPSAP